MQRLGYKLSLESKNKYEKEGDGSNMCGMYFGKA